MLTIFTDVVLPVFVVIGLGYLVGRWRAIPSGPISQVVLYLFSPALSFSALIRRPIPTESAAQIAVATVLLAAVTLAVVVVGARVLRVDDATTRAALLATLFMNAGNYGLSIARLAYGEEGLQLAIVFFVTQTILTGTVGVFIASGGASGARRAIGTVLRQPVAYAGLGGVAVMTSGIAIPTPIFQGVSILADAAIPAMLVVLGIELGQTRLDAEWRSLATLTAIRLIGGVAIAFGIVTVLGITGPARDIVLALSAMPTAVITIILATEFNARPNAVASVVLVSTLASLLTVTALLAVIGAPIAELR